LSLSAISLVESKILSNLHSSIDHPDVAAHQKAHRLAIVPNPSKESEPAYEVDCWNEEDPDAEPTKQCFTPSQITTKFLERMKTTAEQYMGRPVAGCVISDPTSFDAAQTASLISASKAAGFKQVFTIKEPIAAALAFEEECTKIDKKVLVLDFGGHNFNVSLLSSNKGVYTIMASEDDFKLGGVHLDDILVDMVANEFMRKTKLDLKENRRSIMKVKVASEQTKRALSQKDMAPCSIESLHEGMDFSTSINRSRFELLAEPLFQRCASLVKKTLEKNKMSANDLDSVCFKFDLMMKVILVGGSSKVPRYQAVIRSLFNESVNFYIDSDPDESISKGCNMQARIIQDAGVPNYIAALKDEKLTHGVAYTCKDIGIADASGKMCVVIPGETPVPCLRTVRFSNSVEGQDDLFLSLYEGVNEVAGKNAVLAEIVMSGIGAGAVGTVQLDVTFAVEMDMTLHVMAKDKASGKSVNCTVKK
jgi:heat shock protein 1/8